MSLSQQHVKMKTDSGVFGTLVLMLPSRFEGGELLVQHRANVDPYAWNPASTSPFDVKYAAFYSDCTHEVKPVTSGHRLCLTYNLVASSVDRVPMNHTKYHRLETALDAFFKDESTEDEDNKRKAKRPRVDHHANQAQRSRDCQLVYVVERKYTSSTWSFTKLKNNDRRIALAVAKFCEEREHAFSLYLCKITSRTRASPSRPATNLGRTRKM